MAGPAQEVAGLLIVTLVVWVTAYALRGRIAGWVVRGPRRLPTADLVDVAATFATLFIGTSLAVSLVAPEASGDLIKMTSVERVWAIRWQTAVSLGTVLLSTGWIVWRHGLQPRDLGWSLRAVGSDLRLGAVAFLILAPPIYALQRLLVIWFESRHPLIELLKEDQGSGLLTACAISAVIAAPIAEEYLFRGMLLSWLEWFAETNRGLDRDWSDRAVAHPIAKGRETLRTAEYGDAVRANPFYYGRAATSDGMEGDVAIPSDSPGYGWPVVGSAALFSLLHVSHGPDWIPLFFFALGLGYLYQQTRRLLPCIVVHFLLNVCSLVMFFQ